MKKASPEVHDQESWDVKAELSDSRLLTMASYFFSASVHSIVFYTVGLRGLDWVEINEI